MAKFRKQVLRMRGEMKRLPNTRDARLAFLVRWSAMTAKKEGTIFERRAAFQRMRRSKKLRYAKCWVCMRLASLVRHHVIQIQNGCGNWSINLVAICEGCHAEIHPWMDASNH